MKEDFPPVVIRVDSSQSIGIGHVMRCLALAEGLKKAGREVFWISNCKIDTIVKRLVDGGIEIISLLTSSVFDRIKARSKKVPWVVLDGYHFDGHYQESIKQMGCRLLIVDDNAYLPSYTSDILLNQNVYAEKIDYKNNSDCLLLLGSHYTLLREECLKKPGWSRSTAAKLKKILVTLGGADQQNVTDKVIKAFQFLGNYSLEVKVIIGIENPHQEVLFKTIRSLCLQDSVQLIEGKNIQFGELLSWADVAISAAGSTVWELSQWGVPTILIITALNQESIANTLHEDEMALNLGWHEEVTIEKIAEAIRLLLTDVQLRDTISENIGKLVDGKGVERIVGLFNFIDETNLNNDSLNIREATLSDKRTLWRLANDSEVRRYSFQPEFIKWEDHENWYRKKISSEDTKLFVLEVQDTLVAQIRYDRISKDTAEVSYSVMPLFRGKGLGAKLLEMTYEKACNDLGVMCIQGLVLENNLPSIRAFLKTGYRRLETGLKKNNKACYLFERENK